MKKLVSVFLILSLIFAIALVQTKSESKIQKEASEKFKSQNKIRVLVEQKNQDSKTLSSSKDFPGKEKHKIDGKISLEVSEKEFQELQKDSTIKSISLIGEKKIFLQDSVILINASTTWPRQISGVNLTGAGQTACILDTGTNFSHLDLIGKNLTYTIDCVNENCMANSSISDDNGHGTHVSGIVVANGNIKGVAPEANLIAVKVCNSAGSCTDDDIRAGIDWCVSNYATYNISAISLSLGSDTLYSNYCDYTDDPSNITLGINNAVAKNISVIVATGNAGNTTAISSPACIQNATAIGSIRKDDSTFDFNRNSLVKLISPGVSINSTYINGKYTVLSGTSMATPHATGVFLLVNQFKKAQNNKIMTPSEITGNLTLYGKQINDSSGSELIFSRIDLYSTLIQLDEIAPYVNLTSPSGFSANQNLTFVCNATDHLEIKNLTLTIWNSTNSIINQTNISSTNSFSELQKNMTLDFGSYTWNCESFDKKGNSGIASSNFSLTVGGVLTTLNSPQNNSYTNQNSTTFNCSAQTQTSLTNVTLFVWNLTNNLVYNISQNISGALNSTTFSHNLTQEENFHWNCLAFNNETNSSYASSNRTITLDQTSPNINLISPPNGDSSNTGTTTVTFTYNLTETNPANCSLTIDNSIDQTSLIIYTNQSNTFSKSLSTTTYSWNINCTDLANNQQNSSIRTITINTASSGGGSGGGGGGGGGGSSSKNKVNNFSQTTSTNETITKKVNLETPNNDSEKETAQMEELLNKPQNKVGITGAVVGFVKSSFGIFTLIGLFVLVVCGVIYLRRKSKKY